MNPLKIDNNLNASTKSIRAYQFTKRKKNPLHLKIIAFFSYQLRNKTNTKYKFAHVIVRFFKKCKHNFYFNI